MTEVIVRVHSVHLVNVEQRQAAGNPQTKPLPDLGCESGPYKTHNGTTEPMYIKICQKTKTR